MGKPDPRLAFWPADIKNYPKPSSWPAYLALLLTGFGILLVAIALWQPDHRLERGLEGLSGATLLGVSLACFWQYRSQKSLNQLLEIQLNNWLSLLKYDHLILTMTDLAGNILQMHNPGLAFPEGQMRGRNITEFVAGEEQQKVRQVLSEVSMKKAPVEFEIEATDTPGTPQAYANLAWPALMGDEVVAIFFLTHDITEKRDSLLRMQHSEEKNKSFFNTAPNAIVVIDERGLIEQINPAAEALFGYKEEELKGRNVSILMPEPHRSLHDGYLNHYLRTLVPKVIGKGREIEAITKSGQEISCFLSVGAYRAQGQTYFTGIITDLSAHKSMQKKLYQSERLAHVGELAAGVGHEISNPLTISLALNNRILKKLQQANINDTEIFEDIAKQKDAHIRIRSIVDGLRALARIEKESPKTINLRQSLTQTLALVDDIYQHDAIELHFRGCPEEAQIFGSRSALQQIVMNLLSNAYDAVKNQNSGRVELSVEPLHGFWMIRVTDNGPGVPEEHQKKIFTPFYTTKPPGEGTGLGLSLSQSMAKELNGSLDFASSAGGPTIFLLKLPMHQSQPEAQNAKASSPAKPPLVGHALIVDDEPGILDILRDGLEELGLEVTEAADGLEALLLIEKNEYDFILTDLKMPNMDGPTLIRKIKALNLRPEPPIIAITGGMTGSSSRVFETISGMIDGFVLKPFDEDALYEILSQAQKAKALSVT